MKNAAVAPILPMMHSAFDSSNADNCTKYGSHRYKYAIRAGFRVVSFVTLLAVFAVYNYFGSDNGFPGRRLSATDSEIYEAHTQDRSLLLPDFADPKILLLPYILAILYLFLAIAIVCDEFFIPALEVMVDENHLDMTPDVAGATLMAAGVSAPELFTSFIGTFQRSEIGIGTIVGSAVFNVLFVIGMCSIFSLEILQLSWWPLFRDCTYYVISLFVLAIFVGVVSEGEIYIWESLTLFGMYIGYVIVMRFNAQLHKLITGKQLEAGPDDDATQTTNTDGKLLFLHPSSFRAGLLTFLRDQNAWQTKARLGFLYGLSGNVDDVFDRVDTDKNGHIDRDEMKNCFEGLGTSVTTDELDAIMEDIDEDGDAKVTKTEFKKWYLGSEEQVRMKVQVVFNDYDSDKSGTLSKNEFMCMLQKMDPSASEEDKDEAVQACFDDKGRRVLSFVEFTEWYFTSLIFTQQQDNLDKVNDDKTLCEKVSPPKDGTVYDYVKYIILIPIIATLSFTIPDCTQQKLEKYCYLAFALSIVWIGLYSFFLVEFATTVGATLGIPDFIMGLTFLAAGTSVPDLLSSVIVARLGRGDMAVSSSIGSNIFDILVGLPVPWFVFSVWPNGSNFVEINTDGIWVSILILVGMVILVVTSIHFQGWKLTKHLAYIMFFFYFGFILQAVLREYL